MDREIHTREEIREDSTDLVASETARSEKLSIAATSETVIEARSTESRCGNRKDLDSAEVRENSLHPVMSEAVGNEKSSYPVSVEDLDDIKCVESRNDDDLVDAGGNSSNMVPSDTKVKEKSSIPFTSGTGIEVRSTDSRCCTGKELDLAKIEDNSSDLAASNAAGNGNSSNSVSRDALNEIRCADRRCFNGNDEDLGGNCGNSSNSVALETVIEVRCSETECNACKKGLSKAKTDVLEGKKIAVDKMKVDVADPVRGNCVVLDVRSGVGGLDEEHCDGEKVCRICHLSSDRGMNASDIIQLGCDCKDELGSAHRHCAETWFKLKGNR